MDNEEEKEEQKLRCANDGLAWDEPTMMLTYIKFMHGCLIMDCVEGELRSVAKSSDLLHLYGLYRQVVQGDNHTYQPSIIFAEQRLKWNAWNKHKGLSKQQAMMKWEKVYNRLLSSFPAAYAKFPDADLSRFDPLKPFSNASASASLLARKNSDIAELQLEIKALQMQIQIQPQPQHGHESANGDSDDAEQSHEQQPKNGMSKYVTIKSSDYYSMMTYLNDIKNKMKRTYDEFEKNAQQISVLEKANGDYRNKMDALQQQYTAKQNEMQMLKASRKRKKHGFYSFIAFLLIAVAFYIYAQKRKKSKK